MRRIPRSEQVLGVSKYEAIEAILRGVCAVSDKIIMRSLSKVLKDREVDELIRHGMLPYVYAAGFLSFAGRSISRNNMASIVQSIGIIPDARIITLFLNSGVRSHLIYLYSFYFLLANGVEPSRDKIAAAVRSLGIDVDAIALDDVLSFLRRNSEFTHI
ncbi:MAG: hypothetical protein M1160_03725 [Candidatus Marsarchaeota archaeon]|nr:hypothetical protein [Candidatus Marsarchaeota archaeon]MCL5111952.1 hypothetical protein [Candidatus Marsarchaeota archaeon]